MRTALAAFCLVAVALFAVAEASYLFGYVRVEFGDEKAAGSVMPFDDGSDDAPVADAPDALPEAVSRQIAPPSPVAPSPEPVLAQPPPPVPAAPAVVQSQSEPRPVASAPRIVGGPGITPAPVSGANLPREAVPPPAPEPARWRAFRRVVVVEAGRLDLGKREVELAGLAPAPADRQCRLVAGAAERPCAELAMLALRRRIRALGVECEISPDEPGDPAVVPCRIGRTDLSLWLIAQGWAEAGNGAPAGYAKAEKAARCARKGLWREASPPADCPG